MQKKIERGKVRFDATIAKLQKNASKWWILALHWKPKKAKLKRKEKLEQLNQKMKAKLSSYQELMTTITMIVIGNRLNDIADRYFDNGKKRPLIADLLRLVETENAKRKRNLLLKNAKNAKQRKKQRPRHKSHCKIRKERKRKGSKPSR